MGLDYSIESQSVYTHLVIGGGGNPTNCLLFSSLFMCWNKK